jgi:hypothetical protein
MLNKSSSLFTALFFAVSALLPVCAAALTMDQIKAEINPLIQALEDQKGDDSQLSASIELADKIIQAISQYQCTRTSASWGTASPCNASKGEKMPDDIAAIADDEARSEMLNRYNEALSNTVFVTKFDKNLFLARLNAQKVSSEVLSLRDLFSLSTSGQLTDFKAGQVWSCHSVSAFVDPATQAPLSSQKLLKFQVKGDKLAVYSYSERTKKWSQDTRLNSNFVLSKWGAYADRGAFLDKNPRQCNQSSSECESTEPVRQIVFRVASDKSLVMEDAINTHDLAVAQGPLVVLPVDELGANAPEAPYNGLKAKSSIQIDKQALIPSLLTANYAPEEFNAYSIESSVGRIVHAVGDGRVEDNDSKGFDDSRFELSEDLAATRYSHCEIQVSE